MADQIPKTQFGYASDIWGVEKIFLMPQTANVAVAGTVGQMIFNEDITITELGYIVNTVVSGASGNAVTVSEGEFTLSTLTVNTGSASTVKGACVSTNTVSSANTISSGDKVTFNVSGVMSQGSVYIYIKYRSRYSQT